MSLALLAAFTVAECSPLREAGQAVPGNALATDGVQSSGTVGTEHARVGEIWYFALPVPNNTSSTPIAITKVSVLHIPAGIKVLGYGA
ncbi:hypothetical protein ABZ723_07695 [Streptomyces sp. NPDC006700]